MWPNVGRMVASVIALAFGGPTSTDYAPSPRSGPKPKGGAGADRAAKRLADKLKSNTFIPDVPVFTRQQLRFSERVEGKRALSRSKSLAMRKKLPGGSAAVT